jgi:entericidin B
MTKIITLSLALILSLSACETFEGMGRDIEKAGGKLSDTASDTKEKM